MARIARQEGAGFENGDSKAAPPDWTMSRGRPTKAEPLSVGSDPELQKAARRVDHGNPNGHPLRPIVRIWRRSHPLDQGAFLPGCEAFPDGHDVGNHRGATTPRHSCPTCLGQRRAADWRPFPWPLPYSPSTPAPQRTTGSGMEGRGPAPTDDPASPGAPGCGGREVIRGSFRANRLPLCRLARPRGGARACSGARPRNRGP